MKKNKNTILIVTGTLLGIALVVYVVTASKKPPVIASNNNNGGGSGLPGYTPVDLHI